MDVTISPTLSFVAYVQPFVSSGSYADFKELAQPGTYEFTRYGATQLQLRRRERALRDRPDGAGAAPSFTINKPDFNVVRCAATR